jgi:hypothetical protein
MNDRRIETAVLMKSRHRTGENSVHATVVHPTPPDAANACVMRFRVAFAILVDRKLFPLAAQIQELQNVVEDLIKSQLRYRIAPTDGEMRQDKKTGPYPIRWRWQKSRGQGGLQPNSSAFKNSQPVEKNRDHSRRRRGRTTQTDQCRPRTGFRQFSGRLRS